MNLIAIDDPDDPRVAGYRDVKDRDLTGREGLFMAEGEVVLNVLARSRTFEAVSLLVADKRVAKLTPVLEALGAPVYAASQAVIDSIAGFDLHRGILALARRKVISSPEHLLGAPLVMVLHGIGNHDNMGGLFRNAAAFGVGAVLLDPTCCDPLYRKAIRVSVGGVLQVPFARLENDGVELLLRHGYEVLALSPAGAERLSGVAPTAKTAVVLGAEGPGLLPSVLARTRTVSIPMAGGFDSLNVATAGAIVLHHLAARLADSAPP